MRKERCASYAKSSRHLDIYTRYVDMCLFKWFYELLFELLFELLHELLHL